LAVLGADAQRRRAGHRIDDDSVSGRIKLLPTRPVALVLKAMPGIDAILVNPDRTVVCNPGEMHPLPRDDRFVIVLIIASDSQAPLGIENIEADPVGTVRVV